MSRRQRDTTSLEKLRLRKTSSRGNSKGSTMIVLPIVRSMTSINGMTWFDGALISVKYFKNRHSFESTIGLRTTSLPVREIAWRIVGLSFDGPLVSPTIWRSGMNYDLQELIV